MAYFNYQLAEKRGLSPRDAHLISMINQNKTEDVSEQIGLEMGEDNMKRLLAFELVTMIKGTKKQTDFQKLRLSKKGKKWYRDLQTVNTVHNDFEMFNYVKRIYMDLGKDIGDDNTVVNLIAWFRAETGFNHKQIYILLKTFVEDDSQMEYSNVLEYVFWKRPHLYATNQNLKDSRIWKYYNHHKAMFENKFKALVK